MDKPLILPDLHNRLGNLGRECAEKLASDTPMPYEEQQILCRCLYQTVELRQDIKKFLNPKSKTDRE
jgi:hypothetical protein